MARNIGVMATGSKVKMMMNEDDNDMDYEYMDILEYKIQNISLYDK